MSRECPNCGHSNSAHTGSYCEQCGEELPGSRRPVMYDTFSVRIKLGNDAMQSGPDVASALREVADKIEYNLEAHGVVVDVNGNTVGSYGPSNQR